MSATIRQRRDLRILTGAPAYAAHQRFTDPVADWEMQRAARTELLPMQPEPALFCAVPKPGEDGEPQVWEWVGSLPSVLIIAAACVVWVAYWWSYA